MECRYYSRSTGTPGTPQAHSLGYHPPVVVSLPTSKCRELVIKAKRSLWNSAVRWRTVPSESLLLAPFEDDHPAAEGVRAGQYLT